MEDPSAADPAQVRSLEKIGSQCFCLHSRMAARTVTRRYNSVLASVGLEVTEFSLLAALAAGKHASVTELAERLAFERTTLVRNLRGMAKRGIIKRSGNAGRSVRYLPTARGNTLLKMALPLWEKAQAALTGKLRDQNPAEILASLHALRGAGGD
jgi:DNA-binding MarR family transcriptional regulator